MMRPVNSSTIFTSPFDDHVVHVAVEQELRLERLLQVVGQLAGRVGVDVVDAEHGLDLARGPHSVALMVFLASSISKSSSSFRGGHDAGELVVRVGGAACRRRR